MQMENVLEQKRRREESQTTRDLLWFPTLGEESQRNFSLMDIDLDATLFAPTPPTPVAPEASVDTVSREGGGVSGGPWWVSNHFTPAWSSQMEGEVAARGGSWIIKEPTAAGRVECAWSMTEQLGISEDYHDNHRFGTETPVRRSVSTAAASSVREESRQSDVSASPLCCFSRWLFPGVYSLVLIG